MTPPATRDTGGVSAPLAADEEHDNQAWLHQIRLITDGLRAERTSFSSPLFPMEYIRAQALESWRRWPEMMVAIDERLPAEEIGDRFRKPGLGITATHFFTLAALAVTGAEAWRTLGQEDATDSWRMRTVRDFHRRTAGAWRADGFTTSFAAGGHVRPYAATHIDAVAGHARGLDPGELPAFRRSLGAICQYSFLLNIECRISIGDTGPYPLPHGRVLVMREIADLSANWRPWSDTVGTLRHDRLVIGLVLRAGASVQVTDIATTIADTGSLLANVEAVALFSADSGGRLTPITYGDFLQAAADIKAPNRALYRRLSGLTYSDKLAAGMLVYFSMLRPWAEEAGLVNAFDWSVPVSSLPVLDATGIPYDPEERSLTW